MHSATARLPLTIALACLLAVSSCAHDQALDFISIEPDNVTVTGARGTIFTGGSSLTHQFTRKFDLGFEVYGGYTANLALGRGELQEQIGGNYAIRKGLTLDFGAIAGQAIGSPHYGFQIGFSKDF